jgi:parvulin-like peptidyl-prolyl isomerase
LARLTSGHALQAAREQGPPTENELATLSVVHAVVLRSTSLSERAALSIAEGLERAVHGTASETDFMKQADSAPHGAAHVRVERVGPFGADGQLAEEGQLDAAFVSAAFALSGVGATSGIIETRFGWHVLRLVEREVPVGSALEDRRRDLAEAVVELRARSRLDALIRARHARQEIAVVGTADEAMARAVAVLR